MWCYDCRKKVSFFFLNLMVFFTPQILTNHLLSGVLSPNCSVLLFLHILHNFLHSKSLFLVKYIHEFIAVINSFINPTTCCLVTVIMVIRVLVSVMIILLRYSKLQYTLNCIPLPLHYQYLNLFRYLVFQYCNVCSIIIC